MKIFLASIFSTDSIVWPLLITLILPALRRHKTKSFTTSKSQPNGSLTNSSEMYLLTLGLSRSGFFGRTDPLVNALTSLKYQSDLSNMMVGASGAYYFKALQRIAGLYNNSPNTLSAEYQAGRGAYDLVVPTALSFAASYPGFGPLTGAAAGISAAVGSSPAVKHWMLRNVIFQLYGEEYRPGRAGRKSGSGRGGTVATR